MELEANVDTCLQSNFISLAFPIFVLRNINAFILWGFYLNHASSYLHFVLLCGIGNIIYEKSHIDVFIERLFITELYFDL